MFDLGTLRIGVTVDGASAKQGLKEVKDESKKSCESVTTDWSRVASNLNTVGTNMTKYLTVPILAIATASVKLASDMYETTNKIDASFKDSADTVKEWAKDSIESMGLAQQTALDAAANFGDMGTSIGQTTVEASNMSTSLVQLAADMASFKNISIDRAQTALTGIYTGETEALKGLGIVMTESNLETYRMNQGIAKSYSEMSQAEKVALRYNYVMSVTTNAQGDFVRTSGGMANQSRMLKENLKELGVQFGNVLLPIVNKVVTSINGFLKSLQLLSPESQSTIVTIGLIVAAIGPMLVMTAKIITAVNSIKAAVVSANISMNATLGIIGLVAAAVGLLIGVFAAQQAAQEELDAQTREEHHKALDETAAKYREVAGAQVETAETTQTLTDKLKEMAETDPNIDIKTNAESVQPQIENLRTAIGNLLTDTDDLSDSIDGVNTSLDDYVTSLAEARKATTIEHIMNLTQAYNDGLIPTQELYNQYVNEAISGYKDYEAAIQNTTGAFDTLIEGFNGGGKLTLEQTNALLTGASSIAANGTPLGQQLMSAADGMAKLTQAEKDGKISNEGYNVTAQQTAGILSVDVSNAVNSVITAYNNYTSEVDSATAAEAKQREDTQAQIDSLSVKRDAATLYWQECSRTGDVISAIEAVEKKYGTETANALKESFTTKHDTWSAGYTEGVNLAHKWASDVRVAEEDLNKDTGYIAQQRKDAIINAEKKLQSELGNATTGWTDKQIDEFARLAKMSGLKLDDGFINMIKASNKFITDSQSSFNQAGEFSATAFETGLNNILPYLQGLNKTANGNGYTIGTGVSDGVAVGIRDSEYKAINAAVNMVKNAIKAAKNAGEIKSPSKKAAKELGKPLAQGVGVGFDEETQNVMKTIKVNMDKIIVGTSTAVNAKTSEVKASSNGNMLNVLKTLASQGGKSSNVNQNNNFNFTEKPLTPYEQIIKTRKISKELAGAFA